jgi:hypothetical protein
VKASQLSTRLSTLLATARYPVKHLSTSCPSCPMPTRVFSTTPSRVMRAAARAALAQSAALLQARARALLQARLAAQEALLDPIPHLLAEMPAQDRLTARLALTVVPMRAQAPLLLLLTKAAAVARRPLPLTQAPTTLMERMTARRVTTLLAPRLMLSLATLPPPLQLMLLLLPLTKLGQSMSR